MKRSKGKLVKWDGQKAFGFLQLIDSKEQVFIHKNALNNKYRTPKMGDIITFTFAKDKHGRTCAADAMFSGEKRTKKKAKSNFSSDKTPSRSISLYIGMIFLIALTTSFLAGLVPFKLLALYLVMSCVSFLAYAIDKSKAERGNYRTQESTLHAFAVLGGWPGSAFGQYAFRHKTQKAAFKRVFWVSVIVNVLILTWLLTESSGIFLRIFQ